MGTTITPSETQGNYAYVNGIKMYHELHGNGFPLVLIHGGGSTLGTSFGAVIPELAKTHRVVAVELQAHGHTGDRDAPETFAQDASDIAELLKQLGIAKANVFGFSNGGHNTIELALRYPSLVNKLIIASAFYNRDGVFNGFWKAFDNPKLSNMPKVYQDAFLAINNDPAGLLNMFNKDLNRMRIFEGWTAAQISSIQAPTLVAIGDRDIVTPEHAVEMCRLLPNGRLAIIPGNHGSFMGEAMSPDPDSKVPALFVALVNEFLCPAETN